MSNDDSLAAQVPVLKAIADPTRLRILGLLAAHPHTGRELADALALSAPTVSHHMQRLVAVGVVTATPEATRRRYALNEALWGPLRDAPTPAPGRDANEAQEVPAGESAWLRALLHGAGVGA